MFQNMITFYCLIYSIFFLHLVWFALSHSYHKMEFSAFIFAQNFNMPWVREGDSDVRCFVVYLYYICLSVYCVHWLRFLWHSLNVLLSNSNKILEWKIHAYVLLLATAFDVDFVHILLFFLLHFIIMIHWYTSSHNICIYFIVVVVLIVVVVIAIVSAVNFCLYVFLLFWLLGVIR